MRRPDCRGSINDFKHINQTHTVWTWNYFRAMSLRHLKDWEFVNICNSAGGKWCLQTACGVRGGEMLLVWCFIWRQVPNGNVLWLFNTYASTPISRERTNYKANIFKTSLISFPFAFTSLFWNCPGNRRYVTLTSGKGSKNVQSGQKI